MSLYCTQLKHRTSYKHTSNSLGYWNVTSLIKMDFQNGQDKEPMANADVNGTTVISEQSLELVNLEKKTEKVHTEIEERPLTYSISETPPFHITLVCAFQVSTFVCVCTYTRLFLYSKYFKGLGNV